MAIQAILAFALETDKIEQKNMATVIQTKNRTFPRSACRAFVRSPAGTTAGNFSIEW